MSLSRVAPLALLAVVLAAFPSAAHADEKGTTKKPALVFDAARIDYGVVDQRSEYSREIGFTNTSAERLTDLRAKVSCSCYSVTLSHTELAPKEKGTLTVRLRTHGFLGAHSKPLALLYRGAPPDAKGIRIFFNVVGGVLVDRLHLGEKLVGTKPSGTAKLRWYEGVGQPFEIVKIEVPGQPLRTRVEAFVPQTEKDKNLRGYVIHFGFTQPPPRGIYSKKAIVTTTHPKQKRVLIPITANIVGKVWVQTSRIYLGLVPQGATKSAAVAFKAFEGRFKLGALSARARKGVLRVTIEDGFGPLGPHKKLRVTVPADAPPGSLDDVIELRTEVPGEELVTVEVRGRVFVKR